MHETWIEPALERNLRPVRAPGQLWDLISRPPKRGPRLNLKLASALAAVVMASAWALHPRTASIESSRAGEIREWVRARTGLDVSLAPDSRARLLGAKASGKSAEVRFRVAGREGVLRIAKAGPSDGPGHRFLSRASWAMGGQMYTVAAGDVQAACALCHAGEVALN